MGLSGIKIILVEPAGPLNVGSVARVMKNMGLEQLILVNPRCDYLGEDARLMAVHAGDILDKAQVVHSLPDALVGCQRAIATTAQNRALPTNLENPRNALPWLLDHPSALIFGREDRGLTNSELNYAQRFVRIPSTEVYPSLNLAQGVAICCYELYHEATQNLQQTPSLTPNPQLPMTPLCTDTPRASLEILEGYYQHLEDVLLKIEYLYPHTAASRMEKFRRLYNRAYPTPEEVALLRGILRQVEWAIALKGGKVIGDG